MLLDTYAVIALLAVFVPAIVIGELFFGAEKSALRTENIAGVKRFATGTFLLPCDLDVAREYGLVKQRLRKRGKPIPENDIWIAATARFYKLVLVTRDRHFDEVDDLDVVSW